MPPGREPPDAKTSINPMPSGKHAGRRLPNGAPWGDPSTAPRCQARSKRTGLPCRQPAVNGKRVCRMHGAGGGAPSGRRNGRYRHGACTIKFRALYREATTARRQLYGLIGLARAPWPRLPKR